MDCGFFVQLVLNDDTNRLALTNTNLRAGNAAAVTPDLGRGIFRADQR
jgi:hypothetical protein